MAQEDVPLRELKFANPWSKTAQVH